MKRDVFMYFYILIKKEEAFIKYMETLEKKIAISSKKKKKINTELKYHKKHLKAERNPENESFIVYMHHNIDCIKI